MSPKEVVKRIYLIGLFILPFFFWPAAAIKFEVPKVYFFDFWVEMMSIWLVWDILKNDRKIKFEKIHLLLILFLGVAVISAVFGVDLMSSLIGNAYRVDGILTLVHLIAFVFITSFIWDKEMQKKVPFVFALTTAMLAIVGNQVFGNENFLAGCLVVGLPFIAAQIPKAKKFSFPWIAGLIAVLAKLVMIGSWGGILGGILFVCFWILTKLNMSRKVIVYLFLALALFGFIASAQVILHQKSFESRERIFARGLIASVQKPVLGWGWANFSYAFKSIDYPMHYRFDIIVDKAHSSILEVLVTTGIVGLGLYLYILVYALKKLSDKKIPALFLIAFLLYIFHSQTNVISLSEEIVFWFSLAIASRV